MVEAYRLGTGSTLFGGAIILGGGFGPSSQTNNQQDGSVAFFGPNASNYTVIDGNSNLQFGAVGTQYPFNSGSSYAGGEGTIGNNNYYYVTVASLTAPSAITIPANTRVLVVTASGTISGSTNSLVISFPQYPIDGHEIEIHFLVAVSSFSLKDYSGATGGVLGPPGSIAANSCFGWRFIQAGAPLNKWARRF